MILPLRWLALTAVRFRADRLPSSVGSRRSAVSLACDCRLMKNAASWVIQGGGILYLVAVSTVCWGTAEVCGQHVKALGSAQGFFMRGMRLGDY